MAGGLAEIFNALRTEKQPSPVSQNLQSKQSVDLSALGNEQRQVFRLIEDGNESLFITGKAGTGKSFLLEHFVAKTRKRVAVVAPTGVAAIKVGGQTIHSFFKLPFDIPQDDQGKEGLKPYGNRKEMLKGLDAIVIDEVSMVRSDVMDAIDFVLKSANDNNLPFGGKQMLMFGDLYQLPPVANPQVSRYLEDRFGGTFFYYAPAVFDSELGVVELQHVFRQNDMRFVEILNEVREGQISNESLTELNKRASVTATKDPAVLIAPTNDVVTRINEAMLDQLDEEEYVYEAVIEGEFSEKSLPVQKTLRLKVGARVMMLKNDLNTDSTRPDEKARWVNGTLGVVAKLTTDQIWVMINGVTHQINRERWGKFQYSYDAEKKKLSKRVEASVSQFPVSLAWAVTVHKAQGATYKSVAVDLADGMFAPGQTYVALSRCVSLDNLYLTRPLERRDILVNNEAAAFMRDHVETV